MTERCPGPKRARATGITGDARRSGPWLAEVATARARFDEALHAQAATVRDAHPIHPARLTEDLLAEEKLDADARALLQGHAKEIKDSASDYRRLFALVRAKLARERGFTL